MRSLPDAVTIEQWHHAVYGERWSILDDDARTVLTFPTELEARRQCREYGWVVGLAGEMLWEGAP